MDINKLLCEPADSSSIIVTSSSSSSMNSLIPIQSIQGTQSSSGPGIYTTSIQPNQTPSLHLEKDGQYIGPFIGGKMWSRPRDGYLEKLEREKLASSSTILLDEWSLDIQARDKPTTSPLSATIPSASGSCATRAKFLSEKRKDEFDFLYHHRHTLKFKWEDVRKAFNDKYTSRRHIRTTDGLMNLYYDLRQKFRQNLSTEQLQKHARGPTKRSESERRSEYELLRECKVTTKCDWEDLVKIFNEKFPRRCRRINTAQSMRQRYARLKKEFGGSSSS